MSWRDNGNGKGKIGRPKGSHDISPLVRLNSMRALRELVKRRGKPLPEIFADEIERVGLTEWLGVMARYQVTAKHVSVDANVQHDHRHTVEPLRETATWIEAVIGDAEEVETKELSSH